MKRSAKPKPVTLNLVQQDKFKDQILIVLADYKNCSLEFLQSEGFRLDVSHRIMLNLRAVSTMKTIRSTSR
jgi:hypothetical protein